MSKSRIIYKSKRHLLALPIITIVALAGAYYLPFSQAATPTADFEAESADVVAPATTVTDAAASGGSALQFKTQAFVHPGIHVDNAQLNFVKSKLVGAEEPWNSGYNKFYSWARGAAPHPDDGITYIGYPNTDVALNCDVDQGMCNSVTSAGIAAYTQALMYYYKGSRTAGQNSIRTLNAFSTHLKSQTGSQAKLQLAWSAEAMMRAAEIMRYTYTPGAGEQVFNVSAFETLVRDIYVPAFVGTTPEATSSNGNWDLSFINATMSIAVFLDDRALFDAAVDRWRERTKAYIYLTTDGVEPVQPPGGRYNDPVKLKCFWAGAGTVTTDCPLAPGFQYINGMIQEQCRDASHMVMGLSSIVYAAETARIQGVDLFAEEKTRITTGYEQAAQYYESFLSSGSTTWPTSPCGKAPLGGVGSGSGFISRLGWEVGYNAYANRSATPMPETLKLINRFRPSGGANQLTWETLTHAGQ